ncbi:hypothetical protein QO010_002727 [Caulobacter ginsengisoli]|uniref:Uncharacterized protein n=1 Tax=Caulobacter ginsengisoli TaxID=400775 RepID=A0ABU0ISF7_9CAUL|nr:hypothetical protein [Caulobacter ginsengisoli]MDQ0464943.1 hypothetical protein [Caulobacter ginsengisoli]
MKRLFALFAALLLFPAMAAAAPAGGPPEDTVFVFMSTMTGALPAQGYVELPKTAPVDSRITLWTATVARADDSVAGHKGFLMLFQMTFDCRTRMHRWEGGIVLDAADAIIGRKGPDDWETIEPKSVNELALKTACGESDPPDELYVGVPAVRADAASRSFD